jgi:hypothetical protein
VAAASAHAVTAEAAATMPAGGPFPVALVAVPWVTMTLVAMPFVAGFAMSKHIERFSF